MKTRVGKIARLPHEIREELNQRLENGQQGPDLLDWLNSLPETKSLLAQKFNSQPITRSNLSDWRHGGYQDWLRLQAREERIQRVAESGGSLKELEGSEDLFENFARLVVAELASDLESLDDAKNPDQRWQRLRELSRELVRLQNGYNRSRWADLAWTKWNANSGTGVSPVSSELETESPKLETNTLVVSDRAKSCGTEFRFLHHAPCGCVCRKCHSENGPYPYWDAERDAAQRTSGNLVQKNDGDSFYLQNWNCDCTCKRCDSKNGRPEADGKPRTSMFRITHSTKCKCHGFCPKCHAPDSEYPLAEVLRDAQLVRDRQSPIIRQENGVSICLRRSLCNCVCEECQKHEQTKSKK